MDGAYGIADSALDVGAALLGHPDGLLHVPDIVHGVEYPEDVNAVLRGQGHELFHDIVGVVPVAD
jgi:hypothetical protein